MNHFAKLISSMILCAGPAWACDPSAGPMLTQSDPAFTEAVDMYYGDGFPTPLKVAAFATLLRTNEPIFSAMVREGKASDNADIRNAAIYCEMMRANGFVASVTGLSTATESLSDKQKAQVLTNTLTMAVAGRDYGAGCVSIISHKGEGCNANRFVSFSDGAITFRMDNTTGVFRWQDGGFVGTINLQYGGPIYEVPGKIVLQ